MFGSWLHKVVMVELGEAVFTDNGAGAGGGGEDQGYNMIVVEQVVKQ